MKAPYLTCSDLAKATPQLPKEHIPEEHIPDQMLNKIIYEKQRASYHFSLQMSSLNIQRSLA